MKLPKRGLRRSQPVAAEQDAGTEAALDAPLTAASVRAVRFPLSQPGGYYPDKVDAFVDLVLDAARWWEDEVYRRDQTIHALETERDALQADKARLAMEIEIFRVEGSPVVDGDGAYVTDTEEVASLNAEVGRLGAALASAQERIATLEAYAAHLEQQADAARQVPAPEATGPVGEQRRPEAADSAWDEDDEADAAREPVAAPAPAAATALPTGPRLPSTPPAAARPAPAASRLPTAPSAPAPSGSTGGGVFGAVQDSDDYWPTDAE